MDTKKDIYTENLANFIDTDAPCHWLQDAIEEGQAVIIDDEAYGTKELVKELTQAQKRLSE